MPGIQRSRYAVCAGAAVVSALVKLTVPVEPSPPAGFFAKTWTGCLQHFTVRKGASMTSLFRRMIEGMQVRNCSPLSQTVYLHHVSLFARYFGKSPALLGPEAIRAYQVYLTNEKQLATST